MARNGSGTMSVVNSFSSGTTISSSEMNANFTDFASEVTNSLPRDGQAAMTGQLKISAGTAAAPAAVFSTDTDTGFYRVAANELGVAVGGAHAGKFTSSGFVGAAETAAGEVYDALPAGTEMLFYQATAPAGWTTGGANDQAVRVVNQASGVGGSTGGSTSFSSIFGARTIAQANLPAVNLTAGSDGAHRHYIANNNDSSAVPGGGAGEYMTINFTSASAPSYKLKESATNPDYLQTSSDGAHTHTVPLGGSGTALDFDVSYMNWLTALKD